MKKLSILILLFLFTSQAFSYEVVIKRMFKNNNYILVCKQMDKMDKKISSPAVRIVYVVDSNVFYYVKEGDVLNIIALKKTFRKCRIYKLKLLE